MLANVISSTRPVADRLEEMYFSERRLVLNLTICSFYVFKQVLYQYWICEWLKPMQVGELAFHLLSMHKICFGPFN